MKPELPKWFPPGYFDKLWCINAAIQVACVLVNGYLALCNTSIGNDFALAINVGGLSMNLLALYFFVIRRTLRDSKQWRRVDRAMLQERIDIEHIKFQSLMREFDEFMKERHGDNKR